MRSQVSQFRLEIADSLASALATLSRDPGGVKVLAGATDVMVLFEAGALSPKRWLGINGLAELKGIVVGADYVEIGALTTYTDVREHQVLRDEFPSLCAAAAQTGGLAIQNRGTLGGNIANASPAADTPPALLVHDAALKLLSSRGERWVPYHAFHLGYKLVDLKPDELVVAIHLPRSKDKVHHAYRKVGTRKAQAISKVVFCGSAKKVGGKLEHVRLALGSVAATTVRCFKTEALLEGQAVAAPLIEQARASLALEIAPIDDIRSTREFRMQVAGNLLASFLTSLH